MLKHVVASKARRRRTTTVLLISALLLAITLTTLRRLTHDLQTEALTASALSPKVHELLSNDTLLNQICDSKNFVYFPSADLLLASTSKGGSTSVFQWLYKGITGEEYSFKKCHTNPPNLGSACWASRAIYVRNFSKDEQRRMLTSESTLRLAVQRDPFDRLISAFNDKFACITKDFNVGLIHSGIVPYTRKLARLPESPRMCMNISEFALALDRIRENDDLPLQSLDIHIRPQQLYFDYIPFDIILDVSEMDNSTLLQPVIDRMPFGEQMKKGVGRRNSVRRRRSPLMIPEDAARRLHLFALEGEMGERRHMLDS